MVILSFLCAIFLGAIALSLPLATQETGRMSFIDSLFTATSATCVTGLIVKDTPNYFTPFGKTIIFVLFQAGGLGIMTFSTLFAVILGRRIGLREGEVFRNTFGKQNIIGLKKLIAYILGITFIVELAGASLLFLRWRAVTDWSLFENIYNSVFHAVSAFCNAGFALFSDNFIGYRGDPVINIVMVMLIIAGGIGFVVILDLLGLFFKEPHARRLSLQSKIVLITSFILILAGAALFFLFEKNNTLAGLSASDGLWCSFFQSVTARTAGFNTVPIDRLTIPALTILIFLMFIGASPGSTGGGIKTSTFATLFAYVGHALFNKKRVMMFGRSIPHKVIRESLIIILLSAAWVFVFTVILTYLQLKAGRADISFMQALFEVTSAFGTVGLSTGITSTLDTMSKLCIIATMIAGRVGPLTLAFAVAYKEKQDVFVFPEESIMVG